LDGFKYINDSLGHQAGRPGFWSKWSRRLRSVTRQGSTTRGGVSEAMKFFAWSQANVRSFLMML